MIAFLLAWSFIGGFVYVCWCFKLAYEGEYNFSSVRNLKFIMMGFSGGPFVWATFILITISKRMGV